MITWPMHDKGIFQSGHMVQFHELATTVNTFLEVIFTGRYSSLKSGHMMIVGVVNPLTSIFTTCHAHGGCFRGFFVYLSAQYITIISLTIKS